MRHSECVAGFFKLGRRALPQAQCPSPKISLSRQQSERFDQGCAPTVAFLRLCLFRRRRVQDLAEVATPVAEDATVALVVRALGVPLGVERRDNIIGAKRIAVAKLHALPQVERELCCVGADVPLFGQRWNELRAAELISPHHSMTGSAFCSRTS